MKVSRAVVAMVLVGLSVAFLGLIPTADAGGPSAKTKCRVGTPARVQIAIAANGLAPGSADFVAQNDKSGALSSPLNAPVDVFGDAAAEWDSAIAAGDPAEGARGPIDAGFVGVGGSVTGYVIQGGNVVAKASATCGAK
jgi:hypothetical protein